MLTLAQQSSFNVIFLDVTVLIFSLIDYLRVFFSVQYKGSRVTPVCRMRLCEFSTHYRRWRHWQTRCPSFRASCRPVRTCALSGMRYFCIFTFRIKLEYFISHRIFFQFSSCLHSDKNLFPTGLLPGDQADQSCASA